jgi:hypothetical protein
MLAKDPVTLVEEDGTGAAPAGAGLEPLEKVKSNTSRGHGDRRSAVAGVIAPHRSPGQNPTADRRSGPVREDAKEVVVTLRCDDRGSLSRRDPTISARE